MFLKIASVLFFFAQNPNVASVFKILAKGLRTLAEGSWQNRLQIQPRCVLRFNPGFNWIKRMNLQKRQ